MLIRTRYQSYESHTVFFFSFFKCCCIQTCVHVILLQLPEVYFWSEIISFDRKKKATELSFFFFNTVLKWWTKLMWGKKGSWEWENASLLQVNKDATKRLEGGGRRGSAFETNANRKGVTKRNGGKRRSVDEGTQPTSRNYKYIYQINKRMVHMDSRSVDWETSGGSKCDKKYSFFTLKTPVTSVL